MQKITIAIDGFSSCGKSTLAKTLAHKLHYNYIDTGAMYRAVTLFAIQNGLADDDLAINEEILILKLDEIDLKFEMNPHTHHSDIVMNGQNIEQQIRSMEVSNLVSKVSSIKEVRQKMVALQRKIGIGKGVVMDGRDIGTQVFPDAEIKLFMIADPEVRARRRQDEYSSKGQYFTKDEVEMSLLRRDLADMSREESPLVQADDAIVLDNSDLSREQQLEFVMKLIQDFHYINRKELSGN